MPVSPRISILHDSFNQPKWTVPFFSQQIVLACCFQLFSAVPNKRPLQTISTCLGSSNKKTSNNCRSHVYFFSTSKQQKPAPNNPPPEIDKQTNTKKKTRRHNDVTVVTVVNKEIFVGRRNCSRFLPSNWKLSSSWWTCLRPQCLALEKKKVNRMGVLWMPTKSAIYWEFILKLGWLKLYPNTKIQHEGGTLDMLNGCMKMTYLQIICGSH